MKRGEVWFADLNPTKGSEQSGKRPVVIISGDTMNDTLPIVIVVPITSKIKAYPTCVLLKAGTNSGLKKDSEAIPFQVRTIAKNRLSKKIGVLTEKEIKEILTGLFLVLSY